MPKASSSAQILNQYEQIASFLGKVLGPLVEVVVTDYRPGTEGCRFIANSQVTGRSVGDPLSELGEERLKGVEGLDELIRRKQHSPSGKEITSSSMVIRDVDQTIIGGFCIHVDSEKFETAKSVLDSLALPLSESPLNSPSWVNPAEPRKLVEQIVSSFRTERALGERCLTTDEKKEVVSLMKQAGIFNTRGSVPMVAEALSVSKPSVYQYLKE